MSAQIKEALAALDDVTASMGSGSQRKYELSSPAINLIRSALESAQTVTHYAVSCPCPACVEYRALVDSGSLCVAITEEESDRLLGKALRPVCEKFECWSPVDLETRLESAQREADAWKTIEAWQKLGGRSPRLRAVGKGGYVVDLISIAGIEHFDGKDRVEALEAAVVFCLAELAR